MSTEKNEPSTKAKIFGLLFSISLMLYIFLPSSEDSVKANDYSQIPTEKILTKLKEIPVEQYALNQGYYKELVSRYPSNSRYKKKLVFYDEKLKEQKAELLRKKRIEKQFSAWSGSHRNLENLIEKNLKDPDSYEHIETSYFDRRDHLIVQTRYRARNGFGGMTIGYVKAKVSLNGTILSIIEQR